MTILGLLLLILGLVIGSGLLTIIGVVLIVVGLVANLGYARPRGRSYWY
jgi:membrane protein implicated in regulation of membrane protease activity